MKAIPISEGWAVYRLAETMGIVPREALCIDHAEWTPPSAWQPNDATRAYEEP